MKKTLDELLVEYGSFLLARGAPRITVLTYQNPPRQFIEFLKEKSIFSPNQITPELFGDFQLFLYNERDFTAGTVATTAYATKRFFNYLVQEKILQSNPLKDMNILPKPEGPKEISSRYYTLDEIMSRYINDQKRFVTYLSLREIKKKLNSFFSYLNSVDINGVYTVTEAAMLNYREFLWREYVNAGKNSIVPKSQILMLRTICRLFGYLYKEGIIKNNPTVNFNWREYYKDLLIKAKSIPKPQKPKAALTPMGELKLKFLDYQLAKGKSPQTIQHYKKGIEIFFDFLKDKKINDLAQVTKRLLLEYYTYLCTYIGTRGCPVSSGFKAYILWSMKLFFKFLVRFDFLPKDPSLDLETIKEERGLPHSCMNEKEVLQILEWPRLNHNPLTLRDKAIMEVLFSTGIRSNELCQLNLEDIDQHQEMLRINSPKGGANYQRVIPIGKIALNYVNLYLKEARPEIENGDAKALFLSYSGHRIDTEGVLNIVKKYAFACGFRKNITTHSFRVTCATLMLKNGADIRYVQEQLGHKKITSTQVYTRLMPLDLKAIHKKCHPREKALAQSVKTEVISADAASFS